MKWVFRVLRGRHNQPHGLVSGSFFPEQPKMQVAGSQLPRVNYVLTKGQLERCSLGWAPGLGTLSSLSVPRDPILVCEEIPCT